MNEFICCKHLKLNFVGKFFSILTTHDPFLAIWMQLITQRDNSQQKEFLTNVLPVWSTTTKVYLAFMFWKILAFMFWKICRVSITFTSISVFYLCGLSEIGFVFPVGLPTSWQDRNWSFTETQHPIPLEKCWSKRCLDIVVSISTTIATFLFTTTYLKNVAKVVWLSL